MRMLRWILVISLCERLEIEKGRRSAKVVKVTEVIRVEIEMVWTCSDDGEGEGVRRDRVEPVKGRRSRMRQN